MRAGVTAAVGIDAKQRRVSRKIDGPAFAERVLAAATMAERYLPRRAVSGNDAAKGRLRMPPEYAVIYRASCKRFGRGQSFTAHVVWLNGRVCMADRCPAHLHTRIDRRSFALKPGSTMSAPVFSAGRRLRWWLKQGMMGDRGRVRTGSPAGLAAERSTCPYDPLT